MTKRDSAASFAESAIDGIGQRASILLNATPLGTVFTGIARYTRSLYESIDKHNLADVDYFCRGQITRRIPEQGALVMTRYIPPRLRNVARQMRLLTVEKQLGRAATCRAYSVYHETGLFPHLRTDFVPIVQTIYDLSLITHKETHPTDRVSHFERYFFNRRDRITHVITLSQFIKNEIIDLLGFQSREISVVPLAPADHFKPAPEHEVSRYLSKKAISHNYILSVATLEPRKNLKTLLEAMACLPRDIVLVCVGWSGWLSEDFDRTIKRLGLENRVVRLGHIADHELCLLYSGARTLVYPSLYEGFGLPIVEAMSCGCPVVCSDRASMPEVAGGAAMLVDPTDSRALAEAINRMCSDDKFRQQFVQQGYRRALDFSWERTAKLTVDVLTKVSTQRI